jgi:hypothetical protein
MVCFQIKNPNLGKFWRFLQWKRLVYFLSIWSILLPLEIFYGNLVYFVVIWYISPRFGMLHQEKSGNPASFLISKYSSTLSLALSRLLKSRLASQILAICDSL